MHNLGVLLYSHFTVILGRELQFLQGFPGTLKEEEMLFYTIEYMYS